MDAFLSLAVRYDFWFDMAKPNISTLFQKKMENSAFFFF